MLNQITLEFKVKSLEDEYRQSSSKQIKNEFLFLFIFLEIVLFFFLVENIYNKNVLLGFFYASMTICVLISQLLLMKYPKIIEYILPVLQILIGVNFRIILLKGFQSTYQAFFYGGLSQYLHIAVFFQGHKIVIQTLILLPLIFIYMNPDSNTNDIISNFQMVFGLVGSIVLKYMLERNRRFQFLDHRENKKWLDVYFYLNKLLENCFNNQIIVVSYSKTKLQIIKANNQVLEQFGVQNNEQLRQIMRDLYVKQALESSRNLDSKLEDYLIKQFKENYNKQNEVQQLKVRHLPSQRKFILKIFQNYTNGEQVLVIKLMKINSINNSKDLNVRLMNKTILVKELAYNLQGSYFSNYFIDTNVKLSKIVQSLMLTFALSPGYMYKIIQTYDTPINQFQKELKQLLTGAYKNLSFKTYDQTQSANISQSAFLFIIINLMDLFGQKEDNEVNLELFVGDNINLYFQVFSINKNTISKIRLINSNNLYISKTSNIQQAQVQMWDYFHYVCSLKQYRSIPALQVIQLVVLKFLLLYFTTDGKLQLAKDKNSLIYHFSIIQYDKPEDGIDELQMLNPITLSFRIQHIEQEYSLKQYHSIKQEFLVFFLFAQVFIMSSKYAIIITAINDLKMGQYEIAITELVALILHFFIFMVVIKIPISVKYILPIMQIICSLLFSNSVQTMQENQYNLFQVFYYGGIALFFHFAMLFQGVTIILQSLALIVVVTIYLLLNQNSNLSEFLDYLTYSGIFIGMIIIKYIFEKNKRLQFIENRENQKWLNIMENSMNNFIIILQYKKRQDHLEIVRYNDQVQQHFQATKHENIKQLLKEVFFNNYDQLIVISDKENEIKISLEQHIIQHQKQSHKNQEIQDIDVKYVNTKSKFGVRVINNFINLEQLIILKLTPHVKKDQKYKYSNMFLLTNIELFKELSSQLLTLLYQSINQKATRSIYAKIVQITMIHIVFDQKHYEYTTNSKIINLRHYLVQLQKQLKLVYGLHMNINIQKFFNTSRCSFQLILISLIEILNPSSKHIITDVQQLSNHIIKIEFKCEISDTQRLKLLDIINVQDPYFDKSSSILNQQQSIWDYYTFLKEKYKFSYNSSLILQMVVLKVLLLQFSSDGVLRISKYGILTVFSFELIEQNQAFPQYEFNLLNSPKMNSVSALLAQF